MAENVESIEEALENIRIDSENGSAILQDPAGTVTLRNGDVVDNLRKKLDSLDTYTFIGSNAVDFTTAGILDAVDSSIRDIEENLSGNTSVVGYSGDLEEVSSTTGMGGAVLFKSDTKNSERLLTSFEVFAVRSGQVSLYTASKQELSVEVKGKESFSVDVGYNLIECSITLATGDVVGYSGSGVIATTSSSGGEGFSGGNSTASVGDTLTLVSNSASHAIRINLTNEASVFSSIEIVSAEVETLKTQLLVENESVSSFGHQSDISSATPTGSLGNSFNLVVPTPVSSDVSLDTLFVHATESTTMIVKVYEVVGGVIGGGQVTVKSSEEVSCQEGVNTIPLSLSATEGDYLGLYADGGALSHVGSGSSTLGFGGDRYSEDFTLSGTVNTDMLFTIETTGQDSGVVADIISLDKRLLSAEEEIVKISYSPVNPSTTGVLLEPSYLYLGGAGQSNMAGVADSISNRVEYGAKGFPANSTVVNPLKAGDSPEGVGVTEYPAFGAAAYLRESVMFGGGPSHLAEESQITVGRYGKGGTLLSNLDKGSTQYQHGLNQLQAASVDSGATPFVHLGQMWFQGEADAVSGTTKEDYKSLLTQFVSDYNEDSRLEVAGDYDRCTFGMQVTSGLSYASTKEEGFDIALASHEVSMESNLFVLAAPCYHLPFGDDRHVTAEGSRVAGAYMSRAVFLKNTQGNLFEPLQVVDSYLKDNKVYLVYNKNGLELDVESVAKQEGFGFSLYNSLGEKVSIASFEVSNNKVVLSCYSTDVVSWEYGNLISVGLGNYSGGAGNLRDSAGALDSFDDFPLHNWAVLQKGNI